MSLAFVAGEDCDFSTELRGELDRQMSETTDTDDTDVMTWLDAVLDHWCEYSQASAEERCCFSARDVVGNLVKICLGPDSEVGERTLIVVRQAIVSRSNLAVEVVALDAVFAFTATIFHIAEPHTFTAVSFKSVQLWNIKAREHAHFELRNSITNGFDDTDTFVTEYHIIVNVVQVRATDLYY